MHIQLLGINAAAVLREAASVQKILIESMEEHLRVQESSAHYLTR
jgi:hypothetical protein